MILLSLGSFSPCGVVPVVRSLPLRAPQGFADLGALDPSGYLPLSLPHLLHAVAGEVQLQNDTVMPQSVNPRRLKVSCFSGVSRPD